VFFALARPIIGVMRHVLEIRSESGTVVCGRCVVADTFFSRLRGLLGRRELEADESLLLSPVSSIHTFFMRFAIDVVFLDRDLTVLSTREPLRPWRMASCRRARSVLELPAGSCRRWAIRPGDRLELADRAEDQVLLVLHHAEGQVLLGRGPVGAATRTISALNELDGRVSPVVLRAEEPEPQ
jgi:uncharacterized protein